MDMVWWLHTHVCSDNIREGNEIGLYYAAFIADPKQHNFIAELRRVGIGGNWYELDSRRLQTAANRKLENTRC